MRRTGGSTPSPTTGAGTGRAAASWPGRPSSVVGVVGTVAALLGSSSARASSAARPAPAPARAVMPPGRSAAPPPDRVPVAPGTELAAGLDQSDPFLTVADGRYVLITSGGTGHDPVNVPVVTSTDFVHWTAPVDALPDLPAWAVPGFTWAPDLHRFGSDYALFFTAMMRALHPADRVHRRRGRRLPGRPLHRRAHPVDLPARPGRLDRPPGLRGRPRHPVDAVEVRPEHRWRRHPDQDVVPAARADGSRLLGSPSFLLSPDRPWQGTIVEAPDMVEVDGAYWVVYSANWYNGPALRDRGGPVCRTGGAVRRSRPGAPAGLQPPGARAGRGLGVRRPAGIWLLYSPSHSLAPKPDLGPARVHHPARVRGRPGPTWPGVRCPGRRPAPDPDLGAHALDSGPGPRPRPPSPGRRRRPTACPVTRIASTTTHDARPTADRAASPRPQGERAGASTSHDNGVATRPARRPAA